MDTTANPQRFRCPMKMEVHSRQLIPCLTDSFLLLQRPTEQTYLRCVQCLQCVRFSTTVVRHHTLVEERTS
jgi:hypothetical protein